MKSKCCGLRIQSDHLRVSPTHFAIFYRIFLPRWVTCIEYEHEVSPNVFIY